MVSQSKSKKWLEKLMQKGTVEIVLHGNKVYVKAFQNDSIFSLSSVVYQGGDYIPKSVRSCAQKQESSAFQSRIAGSLVVDEQNYRVELHYVERMDEVDDRVLQDLLEEFCWLSEEWRNLLDEHDRQDLVYVYVKGS